MSAKRRKGACARNVRGQCDTPAALANNATDVRRHFVTIVLGGSCEACPDAKFCEGCLEEHTKGCSLLTQPEHKLKKLNEKVESKKREQVYLKRRLEEISKEISKEIDDANKEKAKVEREVKKTKAAKNSTMPTGKRQKLSAK